MARLRAARMTDATLVSQIDDFLGELERDLCTIFGFTIDENITESAFSLDQVVVANQTVITRQLLAQASPMARNGNRSVGASISNSSNSTVAQIGERLVELPGDHALPMMCFGLFGVSTALDIDAALAGLVVMFSGYDGQLIGYKFTSAAQGLVPRGSGNVDEFLRTDGLWVNPNTTPATAIVTSPVSPLSLNATNILVWQIDVADADGLHAEPDDDIIIATAGKYHCGVECEVFSGTADGTLGISVVRDRAATRTTWGNVQHGFNTDSGAENSIVCDTIVDCNASDKISFELTLSSSGGGILSIPPGELSARAWVARVA